MIGERFTRAVTLASDAHGTQVRKGGEVPYIYHPLAVAALVLSFGGDEDQAIIGLLHDVIEDCGPGWTLRIRAAFDDRIVDGVVGCSDSSSNAGPKPDWRSRKEAYLRHLETASVDVLLVSICDKLHNASAIVNDLEDHGAAVFNRFKAGRDGTLWYYDALHQVFRRRGRNVPDSAKRQLGAMVARMKALAAPDVRSTFG